MLGSLLLALLLLVHSSQGTYVISWGGNAYGQLGLGNTSAVVNIPGQILAYSSLAIADIRVGLSTHFAMMTNGEVYCAGNNIYGQLGINSLYNQLIPVRNSYAFKLDVYPIGPQTIAYNSSTKDVYGWGIEAGYMLGSGFTSNQLTPRKSTNAEFSNIVVGLSTGWSAAFVLLNGGAYAAGRVLTYSGYTSDIIAKLGTGATSDQPDFVRMSFWNNQPLQKLFPTASSHVCGLAKSNSLYCWGKNNLGQLGLGHTTDRATPGLIQFFDTEGLYISQLRTGDAHTVVLTCGGKVYTWGSNQRGNLGIGSADNDAHTSPILLKNLSSLGIVEIVSGMNTIYARNKTNHWHVWGSRDSNMTLMPTSTDILSPTVNPFFRNNGLTRIATNSKSAFAFAWIDPNAYTQTQDCPALINECSLGKDNCAQNSKCVDTERSYKCSCGSGFSGNGITVDTGGTGCNDIDECLTNPCDPRATCENQRGSFACICPDGYQGDGKKNGTNCTDIDECAIGGYCPPNTNCANTIGSFTCTCATGYRQIGTSACGVICVDVDECNTMTNACSGNRVCNNTKGGYNCPCRTGYSGVACNDVDECTTGGHNCARQDYCVNMPGSYSCRCPAGYVGDGVTTIGNEGTGCSDINECDSNPCHVNATCANGPGTYQCTCNTGFVGNGVNCTDRDECANSALHNCAANANCTNTVGSFKCSCPSGFTGNGIKPSVCTDINECLGVNECDSLATCTNTVGGYICTCPPGYLGSGKKCYTVNCPTGSYPVSATSCALCPAGTYNSQTNVEQCTLCPAGTYSTAVGKTSASTCFNCAANTYSSAGSTSCTACPPGSVSVAGSANCTLCPAGQYGFQGACRVCGSGYYSSTPGATECAPCPPGTFASSTTATSCTPCSPGTISRGRAASCSSCSAGRYAAKAGQYFCSICEPGSISAAGASSCTPCAPGTYASLSGSVACSACSEGTFAAANGSDICTPCSPGSYQNEKGKSSCKLCDNWQYSEVSGAMKCQTCYQGLEAEAEYGSTNCLWCPVGTYRTSSDQVCLPCHTGSATDVAGLAHCTYCMGGYYANKCGLTTCGACDPGTYSSFTSVGSQKCMNCPYGQESFGTAYFCFGSY